MNDVDAFQAIRRDGADAVKALAQLSTIDVKDTDGQGLLHTAIAYGNKSAIEALLNSGIDVNSRDAQDQTPLHYAAAYQDLETAEQILVRGGDVSLRDLHGNTALWTAVFHARGKFDVVAVLLRHGARHLATNRNQHGKSPLDFAKQIGDQALVALLEG